MKGIQKLASQGKKILQGYIGNNHFFNTYATYKEFLEEELIALEKQQELHQKWPELCPILPIDNL
jgi:hypothetical protein